MHFQVLLFSEQNPYKIINVVIAKNLIIIKMKVVLILLFLSAVFSMLSKRTKGCQSSKATKCLHVETEEDCNKSYMETQLADDSALTNYDCVWKSTGTVKCQRLSNSCK